MKLDPFTIFLLLLGLLVIITLLMNLKDSYRKESFVNFQNHPQASGTSVYIPQYTSNQSDKVLSLYDNVYFDTKNGTLIEVFANSCLNNCSTDPKSITDIVVTSRNGLGITAIPTVIDSNGNVKPNMSAQSLVPNIEPMYNQFVYTTSCKNTALYQVFYVSWNKDTYVHIVDISSNSAGKNMKSFLLNSSGIVSSQNIFTTPTLEPFSMTPSTITVNKSSILPSNVDQKYLQGKIPLQQLGKDENQNSVSYDISNGNIVVSSAGKYTIYNRNGNAINNTQPNNPWEMIPAINTFVVNDIKGLSILITSYNYDTVIQLIVPGKNNSYKLLFSYRFNKSSYVTNFESDTKNNPSLTTTSPAPSSSITPASTTTSCSLDKNKISNLDGDASKNTSSVCGDDLSCKWYWYFHTIAQKNGNDSTYFSDDYFLKTEAIPPVCPQCPQCPSSGTCNNCGGGGGCGTVGAIPSGTVGATSTQEKDKTLPPGLITDKSGDVYLPYTDSSGNTRYVLNSSYKSTGPSVGQQGSPDNLTMVDKNGLSTSANPNTIAGGLTTTALGLGQVGSTGITTAGDVANKFLDTAGGAVGSVSNLAGGAINSITGLVGGLGTTAGNVVGGLGTTAGNVVGGLGTTAGNVVGGLGTTAGNVVGGLGTTAGNVVGGLGTTAGNVLGSAVNTVGNLGNDGRWSQQQGQQGQGLANTGAVGSSLGYTGYTPGYTPIDNYSNYGALQSKGGNYMPVTADFSSFRK